MYLQYNIHIGLGRHRGICVCVCVWEMHVNKRTPICDERQKSTSKSFAGGWRMRLTLRSQVSVCGRRCISEYVCVRALHCLWTRYPCAAARRKKPVGMCGAPTHSRVSACVRIYVLQTAHTHIHYYYYYYYYTRTDVYADTRHLCRRNCLSVYSV